MKSQVNQVVNISVLTMYIQGYTPKYTPNLGCILGGVFDGVWHMYAWWVVCACVIACVMRIAHRVCACVRACDASCMRVVMCVFVYRVCMCMYGGCIYGYTPVYGYTRIYGVLPVFPHIYRIYTYIRVYTGGTWWVVVHACTPVVVCGTACHTVIDRLRNT